MCSRATNAATSGGSSPMSTPNTPTSGWDRASRDSRGKLARHGSHQLAKKSTTMGRPAAARRSSPASPESVATGSDGNVAGCGGGGRGAEGAQTTTEGQDPSVRKQPPPGGQQ